MKKETLYAFTFAAAMIPQVSIAGNGTAKRPNILFAFADDFGRYAGIYHQIEGGNTPSSLVKTPVIDRLAKEGVVFLNAHVNAPSSTPCRSSLLSGQYFWRTGRGAILNGAVWDSSIPSYPLILRDEGYHIGKAYKVWSPGTPADAPYGGQAYAYDKRGDRFCRFSQEILRSTNPDKEAERQEIYREVVLNFTDFMNARPDKETPFCFWWGPWNTHREWEKGSGKKLWNINPDDLKGKLPPGLPDNAEIREDFADYLGEIQAFDSGLGLILTELEKRGELDNTIIVVSGDHGAPGFPMGKCNLYNFGTQVPLVIRYPKMIKAGRVVSDFVNLPDLAPTFLQLGGAEIPSVMTGKSIVPLLVSKRSGQIEPERTFVITGRERHVSSARAGNLPYPQRAIVTQDYKYIRNFAPDRWPMGAPEKGFLDLDDGPAKQWYMANYENADYAAFMDKAFGKRPREELYDLRNDPGELHNLAEDSHCQSVKEKLSKRMEKVLIETGDPRLLQEMKSCIFEKYPFAGK